MNFKICKASNPLRSKLFYTSIRLLSTKSSKSSKSSKPYQPPRVSFKPAQDVSLLPEFVYATKNTKPHTRIYVMGVSTHGALGVAHLLRPTKGKVVWNYMQCPFRLVFADEFKVDEIGCGYGFTILGAKRSCNEVPLFYGTGNSSNCQIGYHGKRKDHPLEMIIQPNTINIPLSKGCTKKKIACGRAHTMIWTDSEGLWTFGNNSFGQCGRRVKEKENYQSAVSYYNVGLFNGKDIEQLECGQDTSFVLSNGKVYSCGWSPDGQTGRGTYDNVERFEEVEGDLKGEKVVKISCKVDCSLALTEKGDVFGWGNSEYRQLGSVTEDLQINTPKKLILNEIDGKIVDVASSGSTCYVVTENGDVWSWGFGGLGVGPNVTSSVKPQLIPSTLLGRTILDKESKVTKIFVGVSFAAAVTNHGGLYTWGRNPGGCLGLGHTNFQHFPMKVCVASTVKEVSCGTDHMVISTRSLL